MAATATQQVINDGPRNLNVKYTIAGTTGDTTAGILVNVSGFNDADGNALGANSLTLDATTNVNLIEIPSDEPIKQDFSKFGGIKDNSGTGSTGDVLFTTTGYTASGDGGHIYLKFKKT